MPKIIGLIILLNITLNLIQNLARGSNKNGAAKLKIKKMIDTNNEKIDI